MYSLDTNIFLDWHVRGYPPDIFESLETMFGRACAAGIIVVSERVRDEIGHVGGAGLKSWIKTRGKMFVVHDATIQTQARDIFTNYSDLIDPEAIDDEADRWVIAVAKVRGFTVVTHETPAKAKKYPDRKLYVPDVCRALGVPCTLASHFEHPFTITPVDKQKNRRLIPASLLLLRGAMAFHLHRSFIAHTFADRSGCCL